MSPCVLQDASVKTASPSSRFVLSQFIQPDSSVSSLTDWMCCVYCSAQVPLTFKLQFLEEAAEEKRKIKKGRKAKERKTVEAQREEEESRKKLDAMIITHRHDLATFWHSMSIEDKVRFRPLFWRSACLIVVSHRGNGVLCTVAAHGDVDFGARRHHYQRSELGRPACCFG